jgi:hypothetical protein
VYEGGMPHLRGGLPNEGSNFGFALGKVHRSRMHILPEMRRSLHNKSNQTKISIGSDLWRIFLQALARAGFNQDYFLKGTFRLGKNFGF